MKFKLSTQPVQVAESVHRTTAPFQATVQAKPAQDKEARNKAIYSAYTLLLSQEPN
jgi:hypothetical protein